MNARLTMSAGDWLLLILLSVFWGGTFFFVELALQQIPPFTLALLRCGIAAAALLIYCRAMGLSLPSEPGIRSSLVFMAALNTAIPFSLVTWGQTQITSSLAGILNASAPMFTILLAHVATADDRMTAGRAVGVVIGFAGVVMMIGVDALRDLGLNVLGQLALVGAAFCYAAAGVYGRRYRSYPPAVIAASVLALGTLMLLPVALLVEHPWTLPLPGPVAMGSAFGLALISTALAFLLYFRILARAGAVNFQLVAFLVPISAILLGVGVLGERLEPRYLLGMAAIALGLATIDGRPRRALIRALRGERPAV